MTPRESSERPRHHERTSRDGKRRSHARRSEHRSHAAPESTLASSEGLSVDAIAKLNQLNEQARYEADIVPEKEKPRVRRPKHDARDRERPRNRESIEDGRERERPRHRSDRERTRTREEERNRARQRERDRERRRTRRQEYEYADEVIIVEQPRKQHGAKRRIVSGALLEEGEGKTLKGLKSSRGGDYEKRRLRGGDYDEKREYDEKPRGGKKKLCELVNFYSECLELALMVF